MNKKQKFDVLYTGSLPEGETLFYPILMHFAARFNGHNYAEFASDYRVLVESNIKCMEYFNMDMVSLISDPYRETSAFGANVSYIPDEVPVCQKHILETIDDVKNLPFPDIFKNERTLDRIKGATYYQQLLKGTVPVMGWVEGLLAEACDLTGVSEMLMKLVTDEEYSNRLMDKCLITAKAFAKAQTDAGCDLIGIGGAICSQVDAESYNYLIKNRHMELVNYIHSLGARVKLHICGDTRHLLSSISDLGIDIFDQDYSVSQDECNESLGKNVILSGNINPVFIQDASNEEILVVCRNLISKETGKKIILSGGCEITVNTPVENLLAMSNSRKYFSPYE